MKLQGLQICLKRLEEFPGKVRKRVLSKAIRAGGTVLMREARKTAPADVGNLKRSMDQKIISYRAGHIALSLIGQRKGGRPSKTIRKGHGGISRRGQAVPIHLVENPTRPHRIPKDGRRGVLLLRLPSGRRVIVDHIDHPGTLGTGFLRAAYERAKGAAAVAVEQKMRTEIEREASRL